LAFLSAAPEALTPDIAGYSAWRYDHLSADQIVAIRRLKLKLAAGFGRQCGVAHIVGTADAHCGCGSDRLPEYAAQAVGVDEVAAQTKGLVVSDITETFTK